MQENEYNNNLMLRGEKYSKKKGEVKKRLRPEGLTQNANHQFAYKFFHVSFPSFLQCESCPSSRFVFVFDGIPCASGTNEIYSHTNCSKSYSIVYCMV